MAPFAKPLWRDRAPRGQNAANIPRSWPNVSVIKGLPRLAPGALLGITPAGDRLFIAHGAAFRLTQHDRCDALLVPIAGERIGVVCNLDAALPAFAPTHQYVVIAVPDAGLVSRRFVCLRRGDGRFLSCCCSFQFKARTCHDQY